MIIKSINPAIVECKVVKNGYAVCIAARINPAIVECKARVAERLDGDEVSINPAIVECKEIHKFSLSLMAIVLIRP